MMRFHCCLAVVAMSLASCGVGVIDDPSKDAVPNPGGTFGVPPFRAAPAALRRLTTSEYKRTLQVLFGDDITLPTDFEADTIINGLEAIGAGSTTLSSAAVEKLEASALAVSAQAVAPERRGRLGICTPQNAGDSECWTNLTRQLGRKVLRRPLTEDELARFAAIGPTATNALDGDVWQGVAFTLAAFLESPSFLFRVELPEVDPADPTRGRYDSYAMATRLSYFLTHAPPDRELSDLADQDRLTDLSVVQQQANRLLASGSSSAALDDFFRDWLRLERLDNIAKNEAIFPVAANHAVWGAMRDDILATIDAVVDGGRGDYRDLFTSDVAYASSVLAPIYGVAVSGGMQAIRVPANQGRMGLLGKPGFLAMYATNERSSPTLRGKFVREAILCEAVAAPPPEVATVVPEADPSAPTMRDRLEKHRSNATCAACHSLMDPIGLVLESFDGVGSFRTTDHGVALDLSGNIEETKFEGLSGLASTLAGDERTTTCAARTMYRYAVGHVESKGEEATIRAITAQFAAANFTVEALMAAVTQSDGFRYATLTEVQ